MSINRHIYHIVGETYVCAYIHTHLYQHALARTRGKSIDMITDIYLTTCYDIGCALHRQQRRHEWGVCLQFGDDELAVALKSLSMNSGRAGCTVCARDRELKSPRTTHSWPSASLAFLIVDRSAQAEDSITQRLKDFSR